MTDDDDLDRRLDDAFAKRAAGVHASAPDIEELFSRGQQKSRRVLVAGTLGVLAIGAIGISVFAGSGGTTPQDALDGALPPVGQMATTTVSVDEPAWSCVGPLGTSDDGAVAYFESCSPGGSWVPYPTTTTELVPVSTIQCWPDTIATTVDATSTSNCGPPPEAAATTTTSVVEGTVAPVCTVPGCATEYTVQSGDYPLKIAEMFCTTVEELVVVNGWADVNEFPSPGTVMTLPPESYYCEPSIPSTTLVPPTTSAPG